VKNRSKYSDPVNKKIMDIIPDIQEQEFICIDFVERRKKSEGR
jgi:hypothetical protein